MHRWCQSTQGYQWPHFAHLLTLWLTPSFLHAQIDTWCRGRQTGGLSALRLQRCGPAVSRLIQSNLPLSQAGTPGCSPSSSRLEAQQTTQSSSTLQTARREGSTLLVKSVLTILYKSSTATWRCTLEAHWLCVCMKGIMLTLCWYVLSHISHIGLTRNHRKRFGLFWLYNDTVLILAEPAKPCRRFNKFYFQSALTSWTKKSPLAISSPFTS